MGKYCEVEGCSRYAVEKFKKRWLCRVHLCPDETYGYICLERERIAGLRSIASCFEATVLEPMEFAEMDDSHFAVPDKKNSDCSTVEDCIVD